MQKTQSVCLICCLMLAVASAALRASQDSPIPEFPRLTLDNFSPPVRDQIRETYSNARLHPHDDVATGKLGMVLETYGLLQEAAVCYRRGHALAPSDFRWAYYLGRIEAFRGLCNAASTPLRVALSLNPGYVPAQIQLANCSLTSADWDAAGELFAAVVKQHPDNADAYYGLGRVRAGRRDYSGAVQAYSKAVDLAPNFGAAHYALALAYRTLGQLAQAEEQLQFYQKNKEGAPPSNDRLLDEVRALNRSATFQVQIGTELEKQGKLEESVVAHEKAIEIDPKLVQAHVNLIALYGRLGQFDKSEQHYRAAVQLDPSSAESYYDYGVLLLSAEKYTEAETAFRKVIEIDQFHAGAHNDLGFLLEWQGKLQDAEQEYRKAVDNGPNNRQAHFNLGRVLVNLKNYPDGIRELRKTLEPRDKDTPRYVYALGAALARSGDRQSALLYLRQARDAAEANGQAGLVASIERDLRTLEGPGIPQ